MHIPIGVDGAIIFSDQPADALVSADRAGGIGVADGAIIQSDQPADGIVSADPARRIGVADGALIPSDQPADVDVSADRARRIGVADRASIPSDQPADRLGSAHRAGGIGVADGALIPSDQPADVLPSGNDAPLQPQISDAASRVKNTDQADIALPRPIDGEPVDRMTQPGESAGKLICIIAHRREAGPTIPCRGGRRVDIPRQRIAPGQIALHRLKPRGIADQRIGRAVDAEAGIRARQRHAAARHAVIAPRAVDQRQPGIGAARGDIGGDHDIAFRVERQPRVRIPADRITHEDVAIARGCAGDALDLDIGAGQLARKQRARDIAAARRDHIILRVDQPCPRRAARAQRGDPRAIGDRHLARRGFDKAARAARRRRVEPYIARDHGMRGIRRADQDRAARTRAVARDEIAPRNSDRAVGARGQEDLAIAGADSGRADDPAHIARQRVDAAAIGAQFGGRGFDDAAGGDAARGVAQEHLETPAIGRLIGEHDLRAAEQRRGAARCGDRPVIFNGQRGEHDIAAQRPDPPKIDHRAPRGAGQHRRAARHEGGIGQIERRRDEAAADIDRAILADDHAIGVEQPDRSGRAQPPVDRRDAGAGHAVERGARAIVDMHAATRADRKAVPVDDRARRALRDAEPAGRCGADHGLARNHAPAIGQYRRLRKGGGRPDQRPHQHRTGEQALLRCSPCRCETTRHYHSPQ